MEEEDANLFRKPHFYHQNHNAKFQPNPRNKSKSCSSFILKFIFITLFLSLLPLFPSDPPEFLSNTVFAKSWELIHLLIIGIALSYGLFCRVKTHQIPPKTHISQPFAPNILQHSSIFDYEERNPSDKNGILSQSCNLFYHTTEPNVVLRRENGKNFDEMSLGLPVRSLRSRVVDSDYEEEEGCSGDSDSDMSFRKCEKDDILEGNVGYFSPNLCDFEAKKGKFQSFRSPFSGLCSWLPESPNMGRESSWNENQFYMPFSNFTQVNDFNMVGISPNVENPSNFFMPSAVVPPSVPFSGGDFASGSGTWKNLNFGNGNLGVENSGVFIPSPAVNSAMSFPDSDFGSRSRIYNDETESWSESPNLQNGNSNHFIPSAASSASMPACVGDFASAIQESMSAKFNHAWSYVKKQDEMRSEENNNVALGGENANNFMPSAAFSPSMLTSADGFASSAQILKSAKINHGRSSPKKKEAMRSKNNNVALSGENTNSFMPAAAFSPSIPTSADSFASSAQTSKSAKINHGRSSQKKKEEMRSKNNVALSGENTNSFVPSAEFSPSVPTSPDGFDSSGQSIKSAKINHGRTSPKKKEEMRSTNNKVALSGENTSNCMPSVPASADDFVSPIQESKCAKFTHGSSFKKKDEMRSEENKCVVLDEDYANNFMPSAASLPSMPPSANYLSSSVQESKSAKFSHGSSLKKKDEMRSESSNVALGGENANIVMPSAVFSPSLPISAEEFAPSVKVSKSAKFNHGKNKEEMRSESNNVAVVGSFQEEINSYTLNFDGPLSGGKSKLENGNSGGEILDFFKNTVEVLSSVTAPVNEFASLVKSSKDGKCCNGVIVKKDEERLEKMNEQTSIPERWDSDCFVIPSSENNDMRELLQDNPSPSLIDSSEAPSSAGSSTRMSCHEEGSPRNRVEEIDISEIKDVLGENDSYKPSTPSPPPQVQTRRNDDVASSVESSSRALEIRSLLNDDDAHGSPPTPGRRKALSRASHSRRFSCGFFDRDLRKSFKEEAKEANKKTKGDHHQFPRGGKCGAWDCLKLDVKPTLNKAVLKGKSVRTIKPKDTHQEQKCEENNEMVLIKIGISEKRANSDGRKGEKLQEISGTSIIVGLNSKQNSNGATAVLVDEVKEEENDSEIDRKADEFIAKFKQQIRLQKVAPRGDSSRQHRNSAN